jgi:hypothetical protein
VTDRYEVRGAEVWQRAGSGAVDRIAVCSTAWGAQQVADAMRARDARDLLRAEIEAWRALDWERWPTLRTPGELPQERAEYQAALDALAAARAATDAEVALDWNYELRLRRAKYGCTECSSDPCVCPSL